MTRLAFKVAAKAGGLIAEGIAKVTGGEYSHVEIWLDGAQGAAWCFSSREPVGTGFRTLDLSDPELWRIVPLDLTPQQEERLLWFCMGADGRPYNLLGILGIATDTSCHEKGAWFCSETAYRALQAVTGRWKNGPDPWHVAPSGFEERGDRAGLLELVLLDK
jgi:hypothetical protein